MERSDLEKGPSEDHATLKTFNAPVLPGFRTTLVKNVYVIIIIIIIVIIIIIIISL